MVPSTCTYTLEYENPMFVRDLGDACCLSPDSSIASDEHEYDKLHRKVFAFVSETADPSFKPTFICVTVIIRAWTAQTDSLPRATQLIVDLSRNELLPYDFFLNPHKCTPGAHNTLVAPATFMYTRDHAMGQAGLHSYVRIDDLLEFIKQNI